MTVTAARLPSVLHARPAFEGANIRTWIGFKHFMYLVEGAVLQYCRDQGTGAARLFHDFGRGLEILDCSVQLPAVLELDDEVRAQVTAGAGNRLDVQLSVARGGEDVTVLRGKVVVALLPEASAPEHRDVPGPLAALQAEAFPAAEPLRLRPWENAESVLRGQGGLLWSWLARYTLCHYSDRVQHSAYVRALEEVVDRYLNQQGISVGRMLRERSWIPVVSRARVRLLAPAHMEETIHTVFTVTDILRDVMFDARMDCYVQRGQQLIPVATAKILHGYAIAAGPGAGGMAELDAEVLAALRGVS
ncbi:thioesterase family protein [Dactylosporangium sp. CS-033363]|uniref:thioesterase family protein n=1 Tax=Dactylosporangium sp. CS-033363 TaxID=3239935 RepID=UPI003D8A5E9A